MQDNSSDYIFEAYITNTAAYDSGERDNAGTWLYFPANAEEITAAFTEIGLPISATPDMYFFDDYVSDVPGLRLALPRYAHVDDLAMLAQELSDLPDHEFNKLLAVQETPLRLTDFEQFKEYPHNFDYFILIPGMNSDEALGATSSMRAAWWKCRRRGKPALTRRHLGARCGKRTTDFSRIRGMSSYPGMNGSGKNLR